MNPLQPLSSLPIPPSSLSTLTRAGYHTLNDIPHCDSASQLEAALKLPLEASRAIYSSSQRQNAIRTLPATQSAAAMIGSSMQKSRVNPTNCPPVDALLGGGLMEGHILDISGPPGSPKDLILLNLVRSCVETRKKVLFVDCQDMCGPHLIADFIQNVPRATEMISYIKISDLTDFMIFIHNLPSYANIFLLAISCMSFPLQNVGRMPSPLRNSVSEKIRQIFTKLCTDQNVTIAVTSQLATRMFTADGSPGTFDTAGAKGVMVPQLGSNNLLAVDSIQSNSFLGSAYFPSGRTSRLLVALNGPDTGFYTFHVYTPTCSGSGGSGCSDEGISDNVDKAKSATESLKKQRYEWSVFKSYFRGLVGFWLLQLDGLRCNAPSLSRCGYVIVDINWTTNSSDVNFGHACYERHAGLVEILADPAAARFDNPGLRNLVTLDLRAHGFTQRSIPDDYGPEIAAEDVDVLKILPCHIPGLSMGSIVALELAINHERVYSHCFYFPLGNWKRYDFETAEGRKAIHDAWVEAFKAEQTDDEVMRYSISGAIQKPASTDARVAVN
ncbi:hypothetical protein D9757_004081 [Collybiopsis confluens]|uniref:RecA family profile 1 domain-containing protein n=1 Tax=Collybiopsis confluens TaxID=2823264 RepID=A0A8H5MD44_9AGAR|nr:hypothetical protein D9757_004081 [Collybiopsis confluens]